MTYNELKKLVEESGKELPLSATNENGENVIIENDYIDGEHAFKLTTAQHNNWCRINIFYQDGNVDEIYER